MKIRRIIKMLLAFVLLFATVAFASDIGQRIARAEAHIERGVQSGAITRGEAHRLKGELRDIREDEARMLRDGRLNHREKERLENQLDSLEKNIYRAKTDDDRRYDGREHDGSHFGKIRVVSGTYGGNCGARPGNATSHLAAQCNNQRQCNYRVDYTILGDPARGCGKDFVAQWRCGNGPVQSTSVPGEAGRGSVISLFCR